MFRVQIHKHITRIISFFYRVGIWHRHEKENVTERRIKLFYAIYYFLFPISLITGAFASDNVEEFVFLVEISIIMTVLLVKLLYLITRKEEILELLNLICDYGVEDERIFIQIMEKLDIFMKSVIALFSLVYFCGFCVAFVVPFLGAEKHLFLDIGFPLDWKTNEFAYWLAFTFTFTQLTITVIILLFSVIMWYLMANCGLRFIVLGQQIKVMGEITTTTNETPKRKVSNAERVHIFRRDLLKAIASHQHLKKLTNQLDSFLSNLFVVQLTTSGLCICTSIYCLAFNRGDYLLENVIHFNVLLYNIFDIFVIMYFGNEIQLASDRLSYCLFESNWVDRPQSIQKNFLIFGTFLIKPHELVVLKVYPLTLDIFTTILKSAYSMFNILQNMK